MRRCAYYGGLAVLLVVCAVLGPQASGAGQADTPVCLTLAVIDVGQGDCILITTSDGHSMLVDGGPKSASERLMRVLADFEVTAFDMVVCTHEDAEHIGGLIRVVQSGIAIGTMIDSGANPTTQGYAQLRREIEESAISLSLGRAGSSFGLGPAVVEILWPTEPLLSRADDCSVVLRVSYGRFSALLMGDADSYIEHRLLEKGFLSSVVVLKVGRHGSSQCTSAQLLDVTMPSVAIISVGEGNGYDHPSQEVVEQLTNHGASVYRTDRDGTITVVTDGLTHSVTTQGEGLHSMAVPAAAQAAAPPASA